MNARQRRVAARALARRIAAGELVRIDPAADFYRWQGAQVSGLQLARWHGPRPADRAAERHEAAIEEGFDGPA